MVTGAAGFLGSHLAEYHLSRGDHVLGIDNFCSSQSDSLHLQSLMKQSNFLFHEADVAHEDTFDDIMRFARFDLIYNMACPASPSKYQEMPVRTLLTCVNGTRNVLALAFRQHARVVHASTSEVYGDPTVSPQPESYRGNVNPYGPRSCYDEGKRAAETLCYDFSGNGHDVDVRVARIFNTYGENMLADDGRVITNFICQALRGEALTVYGSGEQTRSFCYVSDLIRGLVALGEVRKNPRGPINLGNPKEFTILQLAREVTELVNPEFLTNPDLNVRAISSRLPVDDPRQRCPDISRANKILKWKPTVSLHEGLERTIKYFRTVGV